MGDRNELLGANVVTLSICYQQLSARINRALAPLNLNMTQLSILTHFARNPETGYTISELTKIMQMNQPAVTKAIKAMEQQQWFKRQTDSKDARVIHIHITSRGLNQLSEAQQCCFPAIKTAFANFDISELVQLISLLSKVNLK